MAVEAIVSTVLEQLISIIGREVEQEVRLVTGVRKEVEKLTSNFRAIQAVLADAEQRQVTETAVGVWLDKLKDASYDMDDVLDEWNTAILKLQIEGVENAQIPKKKVCFMFSSPCLCSRQVALRRDIGLKIKEINENLDSIAIEKDKYNLSTIGSSEEPQRMKTTSFIEVSEIYGRDYEKNNLVSKLLNESKEERTSVPVISIVGMGGIGKTTLAQLAYNDTAIRSAFDKRIWVCVSDPFDEVRIARAIIEGLTGQTTHLVEFQSLLECICGTIVDKKFLLILDDVWIEDFAKWGPLYSSLNNGLHRESKILVTTRKDKVARVMKSIDVIPIGLLSVDKSWSLFKQLAFYDRSSEECKTFVDLGREIVGKCKGLPLAIKTIGSLLRFKRTRDQWRRILDSELWKLKEIERGLFPPLLLSYNDLPSKVKRCFSYCAIYPKDYNIEKDELIRLWIAQGYLGLEQDEEIEIVGEECFDTLAMHSFFQDFTKYDDGNIYMCKMHDIVHDFAQFLAKNECSTKEIDGGEEPSGCSTKEIDSGEEPNGNINVSSGKTRHLMLILKRSDPVNISIDMFKGIEIDCGHLEKLPQGMGKLINLRNLINAFTFRLRYMPKGIEKLVCLRRLDKFVVGGDPDVMRMGTLECLKNLNELRGSLKLEGLGNVVDEAEAKNAQLVNKKNLVDLELSFDKKNPDNLDGRRKDSAVLEALQPPPNLESLSIRLCRSITLSPHWMLSLTQLKSLTLKSCFKCEHLPPLGKLPLLESLCIFNMKSVKRVGNEFLGVENMDTSSSSESVIAFPKLKNLKIQHMDNWEDWEYEITGDITIMPSLSSLYICLCHKLKSLPDHLLHATSLKGLDIYIYGLIVTQYGDIEDTIKVMGISPDASIKWLIHGLSVQNNDHWPQWRCTHFARLSGRFYPSKRHQAVLGTFNVYPKKYRYWTGVAALLGFIILFNEEMKALGVTDDRLQLLCEMTGTF
ncbi:hypothetical protein JRO89_XS09G0184800 [Xanthoceras sorbifolium]|uniref:Disease resistance protein RGA3 n=1 Tax=Xanthoceras sorbifolium TaxID=99658 RepID=A0ABQ8HLS7_9ROSI|nr:hypothetical protein JRO89_XS09G0184800 [Xanthoceras sorbifolium]